MGSAGGAQGVHRGSTWVPQGVRRGSDGGLTDPGLGLVELGKFCTLVLRLRLEGLRARAAPPRSN
eukprot:995732-Prorocentrum_minimum.AAC.1